MHLEYKKFENEKYGLEFDTLQDKYERQYNEINDKMDEIVNSKENIELTPEEIEKYGIKGECEPKEIEDYWEKVIINSRYFTITQSVELSRQTLSRCAVRRTKSERHFDSA